LSIVSEVALVVVQLNVDELPLAIVVGAAAKVRVGGGSAGGSAGAGCTVPPPQPAMIMLRMAKNKKAKQILANRFNALTSCIEVGRRSSGGGCAVKKALTVSYH
jgi:hypothetical protein